VRVRPLEVPSPEAEGCVVPQQIYGGLVVPNQEGRLFGQLRDAAKLRKVVGGVATGEGDSVAILIRAAVEYVRTHVEDAAPNPNVAMALADLAVTGRAAFNDFCFIQPQDSPIQSAVHAFYANDPRVDSNLIFEGVKAVLDRAYRVVWFLRGRAARGDLGWIAVSGEDDIPHRPVNVVGSKFPQCDLLFTVPTVPPTAHEVVVSSRFVIATANEPVDPPILPAQRICPPNLEPVLPENDRIILFIHGSDSRLEEAEALIPHLVRTPDGRPTGFSVVSMDLPGSGYVNPIDHLEVAPFDPGKPVSTILWLRSHLALMPFLEQFIVRFISALSSRLGQPGIVEGRLAAVIGGSLGGNLGLRLAQRSYPGIRNVVAYSPGSVWNAANDMLMERGAEIAIGSVTAPEFPETRAAFIKSVFEGGLPSRPQADQWYRDGWPCKPGYISDARLQRQETYTWQSRRWHWRISLEELGWTWRDPDVVKQFRQPILLGAGSDDNYWPASIYTNTHDLAGEMVTPTWGDTFFFKDTGHSIHAERPAALAAKLFAFLDGPSTVKVPDVKGVAAAEAARTLIQTGLQSPRRTWWISCA